jgi:hypothetical protein
VNGVLAALVVVLAYVLLVQAMAAAIVLLSEFILLRIRVLRSMLVSEKPAPTFTPAREHYQIGGAIRKWD